MEKVKLTNLFGAKLWLANWCQYKVGGIGGREAPLGGIYLPMWCAPTERGEGLSGTGKEMCKMGAVTVDRDQACPSIPHPKYVAADTCQGSCLGEGH